MSMMMFKRSLLAFVFSFLFLCACVLPMTSSAADPGGQPPPGNVGGQPPPGNVGGQDSASIMNPLKVGSITGFLKAIIEIVLVFAVPIIVLFIMYAGFLFVTANGEPAQLEKARNALLFAIIGGVIVLGAFLIIDIIEGTITGLTTD